MVNLLGATLPDRKLLKIALLAFHGINHRTSSLIMARLQFHDQLRVSDLTESQLNSLSALLSAPTAAPRPSVPLAPFPFPSGEQRERIERNPPEVQLDPITHLVIEEDLRRKIRADIAHHRTIGTTTGRLHAMGLPVRGQRNRTNGRTAKRLNRIERRGFATSSLASSSFPTSLSSSITGSRVLEELRRLRLD